MLSAQAREVVEQAQATRRVSFVVFVRVSIEASNISRIYDSHKRAKKLDSIYRKIKKPFLDTLSEYEDVGLHVIDGLEGTPNIIVSGPARAWRKLFDEHQDIVQSPAFEVLPNEQDWSADFSTP